MRLVVSIFSACWLLSTGFQGAGNAAPTGANMAPPDVISYRSDFGAVTFPHADHAERLSCLLCHSANPPEKIHVDRSFAHATCTGCHVNSGAGPTACDSCHLRD